jgi:hypothetical protein
VALDERPGVHAANDVAVDPHGTAYVTDTLEGAVYRVDVHGRVSVTADPRFRSDTFGLNGIVWHPAGFVITSRFDTGATFRIDRDGCIHEVAHAANLAGADGSALLPDGSLLVVTNRLGSSQADVAHVLRPERPGHWDSLREVRTVAWPDPAPTTVALTPHGAYLLSGRLDRLIGGDPTVTTFTIRRLPAA